jgi:heat-inducible transcriptional repressor
MLSERQRLILYAIVDDYIRSAEPVGSRTISKRGDVGYSPATIRNEMSDLEDMGFLEQPYTSAGRIPSEKGYRYYVDYLIQPSFVSSEEMEMIKRFFADRIMQMEEIVQQTATILSTITNYTSIVLGPEMFNTTLKHLQIIPLNETSAVAIIVTNTGYVENKTVTVPEGIPLSEIEKIVNILNKKLVGIPLYQLRSKLFNEISTELSRHITSYEQVLMMMEQALTSDGDDRIFLGGTTNILTQPEFKDVEKVKNILDLLDQNKTMLRLLTPSRNNGIQVRIGKENTLEAISDCTVITATYSLDGYNLGTIGILGPTRMEYRKVIGLLDYLSKDLSTLLARWSN